MSPPLRAPEYFQRTLKGGDMKPAWRRRVAVTFSSLLVLGSLFVLPAASTASGRTAHLSATTCVATSTGKPTVSEMPILKFVDRSSTGLCNVTLRGQWTPNSTVFMTADANVASVGPAGDWSAAVATPQLRGTISGVLPASSSGGTGAGSGTGTLGSNSSLAWSISCSFSYPPFRFHCIIHLSDL